MNTVGTWKRSESCSFADTDLFPPADSQQTDHLSSYQLTVPRPIGGRLRRDVDGRLPDQVWWFYHQGVFLLVLLVCFIPRKLFLTSDLRKLHSGCAVSTASCDLRWVSFRLSSLFFRLSKVSLNITEWFEHLIRTEHIIQTLTVKVRRSNQVNRTYCWDSGLNEQEVKSQNQTTFNLAPGSSRRDYWCNSYCRIIKSTIFKEFQHKTAQSETHQQHNFICQLNELLHPTYSHQNLETCDFVDVHIFTKLFLFCSV